MKPSRFEKFLINRGLLESFENNLKNNSGYYSYKTIQSLEKKTHPLSLMKGAFSWSNAPENHYFWSKLDSEWRECLVKNTL